VTLELSPAVPIQLNGEDALIAQYIPSGIVYPDKPYGDQLSENFGQNVGINVSIPIYNNGQNSIGIQRAKLNTINQEIANQQTKIPCGQTFSLR
jgi:hypothetical protein